MMIRKVIRRRPRQTAYIATAILAALAGAFYLASPDTRDGRGVIYAFVALAEYFGLVNMKSVHDYTPSQRWEKASTMVMFVGLAGGAFFDLPGSTAVNYFWIALMVLTRAVSFEFIVLRSSDPGRAMVRTAHGSIAMPAPDEADYFMDMGAACRRHGLGSAAMRAQYDEAAGVDPSSEFEERLRRQVQERRERAALGAEIEIEGW